MADINNSYIKPVTSSSSIRADVNKNPNLSPSFNQTGSFADNLNQQKKKKEEKELDERLKKTIKLLFDKISDLGHLIDNNDSIFIQELSVCQLELLQIEFITERNTKYKRLNELSIRLKEIEINIKNKKGKVK